MPGELSLRNRQQSRPIDLRLLRRIALHLLENVFALHRYQFCAHLVGAKEMEKLNEAFLGHHGSTDVITFDISETECEAAARQAPKRVAGEVFICVDDAIGQAVEFKTTWQSEVTRYLIHGLLHLHGYDDLAPQARRRMKREEERLLKCVTTEFDLRNLAKRGAR